LTPDPGSGIGFFPDPEPIFLRASNNIWVKSSFILCKLAHIFFVTSSKVKQVSIFWYLWRLKRVGKQFFFHPSLLLLFFNSGSGMDKIRIRVKHPRSATLVSGSIPFLSTGMQTNLPPSLPIFTLSLLWIEGGLRNHRQGKPPGLPFTSGIDKKTNNGCPSVSEKNSLF
jgi:hypothetical protein